MPHAELPDAELLGRVRELREKGRTPKEIARALKVPPAAVTPLIRTLASTADRPREHQLIGCWASPGWPSSVTVVKPLPDWRNLDLSTTDNPESGLVTIAVARERGAAALGCIYLVDTWCLGVKDAVGPKQMKRHKLPEFLATFYRSYPGQPVAVPLSLAQHVVLGAVGYARGLGFEPHEDFAKTAGHLGEWDAERRLAFGRDGMPCYLEGPHDDAARVMRTLRKNVGDGNFHYLVGLK